MDQVADIMGMGLLDLKETCRSHRVHLLMTAARSKLSAYCGTKLDDSSIEMISKLNEVLIQILNGLNYGGYKKDDRLENEFYKDLVNAKKRALRHLNITQTKGFKPESGRQRGK